MKANEFVTEATATKTRLDPKCWTGKKIGNPKTKVKGGVRVNNCVPAESVAEGMEPIGGPWKSGEFSRILNAFQVYTNTMGYGMEFYNWANRPQALKLLADKSGTTPDLVKHTLDSLNWGQHPEEEFDDEEQDVAEGTTPIDYTKFKLSRSSGEEEKYTVFNLFYNGKFVGDIGYLKADQNWFVGEPSGSAWGALNGKYRDNNRYATKDQALQALIKAVEPHLHLVAEELSEEFDLIESIIDDLADRNGVDAEVIWEDLESLTDDELYVFAVTQPVMEDWQKANKQDRTAGMSQKAVNAYRRENPGSKLKTAVTTKPSKLKKGSKASKRRKSYCSRSRGQMKMHNISCAKTPDKAICAARRRWNCE
jgi:hypothetical protein